jgi:hypothetical protein
LAAVAAAVGVSALAPGSTSAPGQASRLGAATPSSEVVDPSLAPLFALEGSEGAQARYEARIDRTTGARRDTVSLGALDGAAPALRIEMWRNASGRLAGSLFVEIAEELAAFGSAVERLGASQTLASSQGPVEWADLRLAGARAQRSCIGFRSVTGVGGGLRGVACAATGGKIDAAGLNCLIDRLALTRAGRGAGPGDIVRSPGVRRPTCRAAIG